MKDKDFFDIVKGSLIIAAAILAICFACSCKTISHLKKATSDTTSVHKEQLVTSKVDSSGSKTENTKETVYYPQPIYIQGKDGETKVVFVPQSTKETGKTEEVKVVKDESWREAFDSLNSKILSLSQDKKTKVGPSLIEWILIGAVGLMFLKSFLPTIKNLITKV